MQGCLRNQRCRGAGVLAQTEVQGFRGAGVLAQSEVQGCKGACANRGAGVLGKRALTIMLCSKVCRLA